MLRVSALILVLGLAVTLASLLSSHLHVPSAAQAAAQGAAMDEAVRERRTGTAPDDGRVRLTRLDGPIPDEELSQEVLLPVGSITGRVLARDGRPLVDVLVRAEPSRVWLQSRPWSREDRGDFGEEVVGRIRRAVQWLRAHRRDMRTGPDGGFVLSGLPAARYQVTARLEGHYVAATVPGTADNVAPGAELDLVADVVCEVAFDPRLPDGDSPERATLYVHGVGGTSEHPWSPGRQCVDLLPGRYRVVVRAGPGGAWVGGRDEVVVALGAERDSVRIELDPTPTLEVDVAFPRGEGPSWADLRCRRIGASVAAATTTRVFLGSAGMGLATIGDLAPGLWVLDLLDAGHVVGGPVEVAVGRGISRCAIAARPTAEVDHLHLVARGPDGEAVRDLDVEVGAVREDGLEVRDPGRVRRSDANVLWVRHHPALASGGRGFVVVHGPEGARRVDYVRDRERIIEVDFAAPALLDVVVVGVGAERLRARLRLELIDAPTPPAVTAWNRLFRFEAVQPGSYRVRILALAEPADDVIQELPIALESGDVACALELPDLHRVVLVVDGHPPGTGVALSPIARAAPVWRRQARLDADGRARFADILEGRYVVTLDGEEEKSEPMHVTVPTSGVLQFRPESYDALAVLVKDPEGALGAAGLLTGDLIVAAGGVDFRVGPILPVLLAGRVEPRLVLTVLRGERVLEVIVDGADLFAPEEFGGVVQPTFR